MTERVSALDAHYFPGRYGDPDRLGVVLELVPDLELRQVAAWPETVAAVGERLARSIGAALAPGPGRALGGAEIAVLRIEPLKWWLVGLEAPTLPPEQGATLDLSHSRTHIRVSGDEAAAFLNRHLPLDLREASFPPGAVASSAMVHVGIALWRSPLGYELLLPRGFALSLWQGLVESAEQFGVEVR